jgi:hypothetical protein
MKKMVFFLFLVWLLASPWARAAVIDFEDLALSAESYWNGSDGSGAFTSGGATLSNTYNAEWGSWDGFAYSNLTDTTTEGFAGQYSAVAGGGALNADTPQHFPPHRPLPEHTLPTIPTHITLCSRAINSPSNSRKATGSGSPLRVRMHQGM